MTCTKDIVFNKKIVNTIKTTGKNAYKELSILLINKVNKKADIWSVINKRGLHEIKGTQVVGEYIYYYWFKGDELERLPIIY